LIAIDGSLGRPEVRVASGRQLDQTQDIPLPADKIEFAAMLQGGIIARDHRIA
jgi:hypothetical protein